MKKILWLPLFAALLAVNGLANIEYNNFTGYSPYWEPLGAPNTATYGETFTAPAGGADNLTSIGFYMTGPATSGDIVMSAYIATWTGTNAGTLLYSSPSIDYPNVGEAFLQFSPNTPLTPGGDYVAFLSVSQYINQSSGETQISQGTATIPGGNFVYYNNGGSFNALFDSGWQTNLKPDWAIDAQFSATPEPGFYGLMAIGLSGFGIIVARRKKSKLS
jgi:hypothetical protein